MAGKKPRKDNSRSHKKQPADGVLESGPGASSDFNAASLTKRQRRRMRVPIPTTNPERNAIVKSKQSELRKLRNAVGALLTAEDIAELMTADDNEGGFTVASQRDKTGKLVRAKKGFPAAMGATELKAPKRRWFIFSRLFATQDFSVVLRDWYEDVQGVLENAKANGYVGVCIGGWWDKAKRKYEVNISLLFDKQGDAERFCVEHDQKATFDIVNGKEIKTYGSGRRRWVLPVAIARANRTKMMRSTHLTEGHRCE